MKPPFPPQPRAAANDWTLEVVRGARVGQRHPLGSGQFVLGSGTAAAIGATMVCLADQEGSSPRKMASRHVLLIAATNGLPSLTDLDTPGGTFVNNERVRAGSPRTLAEGDVIQLGAVQLRITRAAAPVPAEVAVAPVVAGFLYRTAASGATCRTWDDFLTLSAQKWDELRDDLTAGRITDFVASVGRPDLAPPAARATLTIEQADERLNDWLGRLPTRQAATPELDVHPLRLVIAVASGGGTVVRKVRVANVGYGLLRTRVHFEGATGATFTLGADADGRVIVVRDSVDIAIEVAIPDPFRPPASAQLVVTAGDTEERRVLVQVERKDASSRSEPGGIGSTSGADRISPPGPVATFLALPVGKQVAIAGLGSLAIRLLVGVAGGAIGEDAMTASGPDVPHLGGVVLACGAIGAAFGGWLAVRWAGRGDVVPGAIAGAGLAALLSAAIVALCRVLEPTLGSLAGSPVAVLGVWAALGAILALGLPAPKLVTKTEEPARWTQ